MLGSETQNEKISSAHRSSKFKLYNLKIDAMNKIKTKENINILSSLKLNCIIFLFE